MAFVLAYSRYRVIMGPARQKVLLGDTMQMPTCPACGYLFKSSELARTTIRCPGCHARLAWDNGPLRRLSELGFSLLLDVALCYFLGLHGMTLVAVACLAWLPLLMMAHFTALIVRPRLVLDNPKYGDVDFHITGPPGGPLE